METRGRFALLCQHFYPELISTGMHMTELAIALQRIGWGVEVVAGQPTLDLEAERVKLSRTSYYEGIQISRVRTLGSHGNIASRILFSISYVIGTLLSVIAKRKRLDGLVVTTNPPFLGLVGWLTSKLFKLPYVIIVYDVYPDLAVRLGVIKEQSLLHRVWGRVTRLVLESASASVVIGRDMAGLVGRYLSPSAQQRCELITNWSDEELVRPTDKATNEFRARSVAGDHMLVQYSGRMARTHNLELLLHAADRLRTEPIIFQFIGDGAKKRSLQRLADELQLSNVQFLGYQPRETLASVLSAADLSVVCLGEEFTGVSVPSKAYGAMAAGVPLLALMSAESEIGRTVAEFECGIVIEGSDVDGIVRELKAASSAPAMRATWGRRAQQAFVENFTLAGAARAYDRLLREHFQVDADAGTSRAQ
jgi:glycosyltransferase involved in cell wall biosynthesis